MRLSTRLLSNAVTTYLRLGTGFAIGIFSTWYILGAVGTIGFGMIALSVSSTSPSRALERTIRIGLVRELAGAIASKDPGALRINIASTFYLCRQTAIGLVGLTALLASLAAAGVFNTPDNQPELKWVLAILVLSEGFHAVVRILSAPFLQSLFAAQQVGLDNLLTVGARLTYALSAVIVFGWLFREEPLSRQLVGFAVSRATLQLADVGLGIWWAKRRIPGLKLDMAAFDRAEYEAVRHTIWHTSHISLLLNLNTQFVAVLINLFFGLTYNSIWQVVVQFSGFARMVADGILRGIAPMTAHLQKEGKMTVVKALITRSIRYQFAVSIPTAILLGVYAHPLLELWVGSRFANDPSLTIAGISVAEALNLATLMVLILLAVRTLRAGFFGVERILYGMGEVRSYSWFSKWATLLCLGLAIGSIAWFGNPVLATLAIFVSHVLFSPGVVLRALKNVTDLSIRVVLRESLPRPLLAGFLFLIAMWLVRPYFVDLTVLRLIVLLAISVSLFFLLALSVLSEPTERQRIVQLLRSAATKLVR